MASENAKIDNNYKKTLTAITDDVAAEIRRLLVDPTTGRLKVSAVITAGAISSLNGLTDEIQTFAVGTTGDDFNIVSAAGTHTFHIPDASATTRGLLTSADWTTFNDKQPAMGADDNYVTDAEKAALSTFVVGPASATDNAIPRYDATTGKLIQDSGITITDDNLIMFPDTPGITGYFEIGVTAQATVDTDGAELDIYSGKGNGTGNGGVVCLYSGDGGASGGDGGEVIVYAGNGGTNGNGGDIYIVPGTAGSGGSYSGSIYLQNQANFRSAILDIYSINTADKTFTFPNLTGTFALQEYNSSNILSTTTGINAKTVATTNLYTVPAGKTAIITGVIIRCTVATAVTVVPTLGVGIAAGEADIMPSTALTGLDLTTEFYRYSVEGVVVTGAAAAVIKLGIDTGATATTMTIAVDLIGYLI